jgi:hypothetical protein
MNGSAAATREDIEDILQVLNVIVVKIDQRFNRLEKRVATSGEERMILVHQLARVTDWAEEVGDYIGIPFVR